MFPFPKKKAAASPAASGSSYPLIDLRDIYKIYQMGDMEVRASDGVSLQVRRGEFVSIVGKSGSGKSTIMNIIGALDVPTSGEYILDGVDVSEMTDDELAEIRVFSSEHLMEKIWGPDSEAEIDVVWTYIGFLRKKLKQIEADAELRTVRGAGYSLEEAKC